MATVSLSPVTIIKRGSHSPGKPASSEFEKKMNENRKSNSAWQFFYY